MFVTKSESPNIIILLKSKIGAFELTGPVDSIIEIIENAGFSSRKHLIHWHSLLSSPFLFIGMVLIGATFSVRQIGRKGIGIRIFVGIILAFIIFFLNDIASVLGQGSSAPAEIAAWIPALMPILISASVLLYLEDG